MFTNRMRMTGFSGLDVADMVHQMMRVESFRLDRLRQQRDLNLWRQEQMRSVATSITQFQNQWTRFGALNDIGNRANFNTNRATVSVVGGGNAGATITATGNATPGNHTITVNSVAKAHTFRTSGNLNQTNPVGTDRMNFGSLVRVDAAGNFDYFADTTIRLNVNGVVRDIDISGSTIEGMFAAALPGSTTADMAFHVDAINRWNDYITDRQAEIALYDPVTQAAQITVAQQRIADARIWIGNHQNDLDAIFTNNANITEDLVNEINGQLSVFGVSPGSSLPGGNRIEAVFDGPGGGVGFLRFNLAPGNTATIANSPGGLSVAQTGFNPANPSLGFNTGQSLDAFLAGGGSNTFEINGRTFTADFAAGTITVTDGSGASTVAINRGPGGTLTIQDMMNAVNTSGAGVNLGFSALSGQFTMQSTQVGTSGAITLGGPADNFLNRVFATANLNAAHDNLGGGAMFQAAQNAVVLINNTLISRESNNFMEYGLQISLTAAAAGQTFNINVARDTGNAMDLIRNFVSAYNELMQSMLNLTEVRRPQQDGGRGFFEPLTEEQRRAMSDREIEMWEERARTGILNRDPILRSIQDQMRNALFGNFTLSDGSRFNLGNAGIRLEANGLISVDETRFAAMMESHGDAIAELFTDVNDGLATRLNRVFTNATSVTGPISRAVGIAGGVTDTQNAMSSRINAQNRQIDNMLAWLERREESLFRQFSAMEQAMMQAQSQMMFFEQLMWGGL